MFRTGPEIAWRMSCVDRGLHGHGRLADGPVTMLKDSPGWKEHPQPDEAPRNEREFAMTPIRFDQHHENRTNIDLTQVDIDAADSLQSAIEVLRLVADLRREKANEAARLLYLASGQVDCGQFVEARVTIENVRMTLGVSGST
jgi:hypothetical protein